MLERVYGSKRQCGHPCPTRQNSEVLDRFFARASPWGEARPTEEGAEAPTTTVGAEGTSDQNRSNEEFTHTNTVYQRHNCQSLYKKPNSSKGCDALASAGMSSRKAGTLPKKLGTNNKGPVGPRYSKGVPYRIPHNTPPDSEAATSTNESVPGGHNADRIAKTNNKTSSD